MPDKRISEETEVLAVADTHEYVVSVTPGVANAKITWATIKAAVIALIVSSGGSGPANASDAETQTGTNDTKYVSPLKLSNWWVWAKTQIQAIGGKWTFSTVPASSAAPAVGNDLANKTYVDAAILAGTGPGKASDAEAQAGVEDTKFITSLKLKNWFTYVLTQAQSLTGKWTWSTVPASTASPVAGPDLANKTYVDAAIAAAVGGGGAPPKASDAETQAGTVDTKYITPLKLANWWAYIKTLTHTFAAKITFTTVPATPAAPSAGNDLTNKTYVDARDAATLATANTYTDTAVDGVFVPLAGTDTGENVAGDIAIDANIAFEGRKLDDTPHARLVLAKDTSIPPGATPLYTVADFSLINSNLSGSFILMNDVNFTASGFPGIAGFTGSFYGNGFAILNWSISGAVGFIHPTSGKRCAGFFAYSPGVALIDRLGFENCTINCADTGVNIVAGIMFGSLRDDLSGTPGVVSKCYSKNCSVTANSVSPNFTGIGSLFGENTLADTSDCYAYNSELVNSNSDIIGGIGGFLSPIGIENCYADVDITTDAFSGNTGGIRGYGSGLITASYYNGDKLTAPHNATGTSKTEAELQTQATFVGWNFVDIWGIDPGFNNGFPYLRSQSDAPSPAPGSGVIAEIDKPLHYSADFDPLPDLALVHKLALDRAVDRFADAIQDEEHARIAADSDLQTDIDTHAARTDNPHGVTKAQVGLGNADNTSDVLKPVSTAQAAAIALRVPFLTPTTIVSSLNYSASAGELVRTDYTTNPVMNINLPNAPANNTVIGVIHQVTTNQFGIQTNVNVSGSDRFNKVGGLTTVALKLPYQGIFLQYKSGVWYIIGTDFTTDGLDSRYAGFPYVIAGDAATLASAEAYTDAETTRAIAAEAAAVASSNTYADLLLNAVLKYVGDWDTANTAYPTTGGTGSGGAIKKGNLFRVTGTAGTVLTIGSDEFEIGDQFYANVDTPGQTAANWTTDQHNSQQGTETQIGIFKVVTQAIIEDNTSLNDTLVVTTKKFWQAFAKALTIVQSISAKWTFSVVPASSAAPVAGNDLTNKTYVDTADTAEASARTAGDAATLASANTYADGKVADTITDGVTTVAPSQNAVFDALVLKEDKANKDATGGYAGLTLFKINFKNVANTFISFFTNANTAARTYTFQDRSGTIADDTDITAAKARANHTGTQLAATISDFNAAALAAAPAETAATIATINHGATAKTTLVDADEVTGQDSAASFGLIRTTWANVKVFLKTYFDTLYKPKDVARSWASVSLALNTARTPSATNDTEVVVNVLLDCDDGETSTVSIEVDNSGGGTYVAIATCSNDFNVTGIGVGGALAAGFSLHVRVPKSSQYRVVNTGAGTETIVGGIVHELTV